jgi:glycerol kinase
LLNGLSRATTKAHIARAGLEGIAFRLREITEHIYQETPLPRPAAFRIDGGAAESDLLVQMIADVTGIALERPAERQATALGAAILAGQALGVFDVKALAHLRRIDRVFEPLWSQDERMSRYEAWVAAVAR